MNKSILLLMFTVLFEPAATVVDAQQSAKVPRIGYLSNRIAPAPNEPDVGEEAFRRGLRELGYVEGKTIWIEHRYAEGVEDRLPNLVAELIQLKVDILFSATIRGIRAAKQATTTIPIVMATTVDPVASGLVESLARPGGNVTGVTRLVRELSGKRLELFKEAVPTISRVGVLGDGTTGVAGTGFKNYETAGRALKISVETLAVRAPNPDFEAAFQLAMKRNVNALITISGGLTLSYPKQIADLAIKKRLPSMCERDSYVQAGCLMSYSGDETESYRRAAFYVDKILKGAKPADLPVEQPTKFEFIINLKTAKQIGLTIPPNVLVRADKVIK
jgi:putative tryptophan/tyrosine transport system substrate-binding protein